nr:speckle-type POZ protein-like [Parasteatoda tepidariorum]
MIAKTAKNEPCIVDCTLSLINMSRSKICSEREKHYFSSENCSNWEFPSEALSKKWEKNGYFDTFSIYCEFSVSSGKRLYINMPTSKSSSIPNKSLSTTSASPSLQEDFRNLFRNKHLSDVKLRVDGETLEAHKNILVARSPVFAVMFDHQDMAEARRGIVDIVDIDAHIMKSFLEFLYTDGVDEMDYEIAAKLLMAAEKYQILLLKEKCAMFLKNEMSEENVCEILSLADAVNHEFLKSASFEYIIAKSATILSSPQWIPWIKNNMELATAIFAKLTLSQTSSKN